jgi:hypothetical protein
MVRGDMQVQVRGTCQANENRSLTVSALLDLFSSYPCILCITNAFEDKIGESLIVYPS